MARSDDDPFGWYEGMKTLQSVPGFGSRSSVSQSAAGWSERAEEAPARVVQGAARYQKEALLGQGGMGKVWLGWDVMLERHVAIKEPHASGRLQLRREAMLMAQLDHPGIARIHDIYQEDHNDHFVMQLVPGASLGELLMAQPYPPDRSQLVRHVRHVLQACEALSHAHAQRIVHGDLSPRNLMIAPDGATYVIDWGLAHLLDEEEAAHTAEEAGASPQGTPGFLAPEQLAGAPLTRATDVWSLGALLYTILCGHPPRSPEVSMPERAVHDASQRAIAAITARCLASDPAQRYADAGELVRELEAWFEGRRVEAYAPSLRELVRDTIRKHRAVAITNSILAVLLLGAILAGVIQTRREAARARDAEQHARLEARRTEKLLIEARIAQARRALEQRDTYQALEYLTQGLAIADHTELRGLAMKLMAISLPTRTARESLPPCAGRWQLATLRDALCIGPGVQVRAWRDGAWQWRYDPLALPEEELLAKDQFRSRKLLEILGQIAPGAPRFSEHWIFLYVRVSPDGNIYLIDNERFLHELDPATGRLLRLDTRMGEFVSPEDHQRIAWGARTVLSEELAPSPCPEHTRDRMASPSRHHPRATHYLCADGALYRSARDGGEATLLAPPGAGFDLFMERTDGGLLVSNRAGTIWTLGSEQRPLLAPSAPGRLIELRGTPYVLVQGMEGELKALDVRTMRWESSLPSHAEAIHVGQDGAVSLIRDGVLEQWRFEAQPRIDHYHAQNGLSAVSWSATGEVLGAVDGSGMAHLLEPLSGRALPPVALTTQVAKAIVPLHGTRRFHVGTIDMPHVFAIAPGEEEIEVSRGPLIPRATRRLATLRDGTTYVASYGLQMVRNTPERPDETTWMTLREPMLDMSMTPQQDALICVSEHEAWRFEVSDPATPVILDLSDEEPATGVALREDRGFVLLHDASLSLHDAQGEREDMITLSQRPLDAQWHPTQPLVIVTFQDGSLEVFEARGSRLTLRARQRPHKAQVSSVSVDPSGRWAATASWDAAVELHDLAPLTCSHEELMARLGELL